MIQRALVSSIVAMTLAGCGASHRNLSKTELERRCLLLTTNDSESHFDGKATGAPPQMRYAGSLARIAAEKERLLRRRAGAVLLLSAGDVLQGRYMNRRDGDRREAARRAWQQYERAGYDVGVLGNHEFDAGPAVLKYALEGLRRFQIVTSNLAADSGTLRNTDQRLFKTLLVRRCGGLKVGFFGLLTPSTRNISAFGDTRMSDPNDPILAPARRAVDALRQQRVDVIVALTHLGLRDDLKLARNVRGIDVIVGGHSHTLLKRWRRVGETVIVQTGERFGHLGYLDLKGRRGGGLIHAQTHWRVRPVDDSMATTHATDDRVERFRRDYAAAQVIGHRAVPWQLRGEARRRYGRAVAKALVQWMKSRNLPGPQVSGAMLNMGGLRTNSTYPVGPVTDLEVKAIHPFRNKPVYVSLTGAELKMALEHACTKGHRGRLGSRVVLHGISMRCDGSRPQIRYKRAEGQVVGVSFEGQRVQDLAIQGVPVSPEGRYGIVTNDYIARGGSGHWAFKNLTRLCGDGQPFEPGRCGNSTTVAEIVERAVRAGQFLPAAPLPPVR